MALSITVVRWEVFLLVLVRAAAMLMVAPAFGARPIPAQVKIGLAALLAMLLTPLQATEGPLLTNPLTVMVLVSREVLTGLLLGFAATLVFSAVQTAAQFVGVQVGYTFSNTVDPLSAQHASFLDTFYNMLALVVFLGLGGHHALISGLAHSLEVAPLGEYGPPQSVGQSLVLLMSASFGIAVRLAMPVVGTMMLADAALALVVRSIPQMNVFVVGLPVKMVLGIVTMIALAPMLVLGISDLTRTVGSTVVGVLR